MWQIHPISLINNSKIFASYWLDEVSSFSYQGVSYTGLYEMGLYVMMQTSCPSPQDLMQDKKVQVR